MKIKFIDRTEKSFESLSDADLRWADLRDANLCGADLRDADLSDADLCGADLSDAGLRWADLRDANLRRADLRGANLDFSCFPLWCGSFDMKVDINFVNQLLYHICKLDFDDEDGIKNTMKRWANLSKIIDKHNLPKIGG